MVWLVVSGAGGVGKSSLAATLAIEDAGTGRRTILLDASAGRRCDALLGVGSLAVLSLSDALAGDVKMESAACASPRYPSLSYLPAGYGGAVPLAEIASALPLLRGFDAIVIDSNTADDSLHDGSLGLEDKAVLVSRADDLSLRAAQPVAAAMPGWGAESALLLNFVSRRQKDDRNLPLKAETVLGMPPDAIAEDDPEQGFTLAEDGTLAAEDQGWFRRFRGRAEHCGIPTPVRLAARTLARTWLA